MPPAPATSLHLVVADILARRAPGVAPDTGDSPVCPALETLLARASRTEASADQVAFVCQRFGLTQTGDLPLAALTHYGAGGECGRRTYAFLTPVHLQLDRDRAYVRALPDRLTPTESGALSELFDTALGAWRGRTLGSIRGTWLIEFDNAMQLCTKRLEQAQGHDAANLFPCGEDAGRWLATLNELQMELHAQAFNTERESHGQLRINSVWLGAVGPLPQRLRAPCLALHGSEEYLAGLARLAEISWQREPPLPGGLNPAAGGMHVAAPGSTPWGEHVENFESIWFAPALEWLRGSRAGQLALHLGDGAQYTLSPRAARRWRWRKPPPLAGYV